MIVKKARFFSGLTVFLTSVIVLFVWAVVSGELRSHNIDGDGLDPNQTITSWVFGFDRYSVCDLKAEGSEDGYSGTYWDCSGNGEFFYPSTQWPLENGLHEEEVPGGWVHAWMELLFLLIIFAVGMVMMVSSIEDDPKPLQPRRRA
jgi:hypothetical protein